ncbi:uncharacterized mitochondrial protein-like protein [Tanacetum coccineum]|uniref:Uncharacterized mitochondrial protein-like protein n=1 Tax=Tanacetum coccineum TaxID=301880 RepID=A0ABQ4YZM8_9ASTR
MDLYGPMRVASVNGKKYILVIVDDYSQFTWVKFLASKDEASDFIIKSLKIIQVRLNAAIRNIRTDNGTEFVNQTLRDYYEQRCALQFSCRKAPTLVESTSSPSSTTVDQDAPSPSTLQTTPQSQSPTIPLIAEEESHDLEVAHMSNNPYFGIPIPETVSKESSSSDVISTTTYKDALTRSCWIEAMQEELHQFERLEVWEHIIDVKTTFLNGIMREEVYVIQPDGFVDPYNPNHVIFTRSQVYPHIVQQWKRGQRYPPGQQISSQSPRGIFLNQSKYALESLKKYEMESFDLVDTSMVEKSKLDEDTQGKAVDPIHYHGMVGTLMYLTSSRPDLVYAFCMCARYQCMALSKSISTYKQLKEIFRYLRGTVNRGLWYSKDSAIALTAFTDAEHYTRVCQDNKKDIGTPGSMQLFGRTDLLPSSSKSQKKRCDIQTEVNI